MSKDDGDKEGRTVNAVSAIVPGGRRNKMTWKITPEEIVARRNDGNREGLTVNAILASNRFLDY